MSFLAQSEIKRLVDDDVLMEHDTCEENNFHQCSYDLRLGTEVYAVGETTPQLLTEGSPYFKLSPGQFAILTCFEEINIPKTHMGFIAVRSMYKMQGLVNISGFHVDPTHRGTLLFAVQNVGPTDIRLKYKEPTFTIFFAQLEGDIGYRREDETGTHLKPGLSGIRLQDVQQLGGSSVTVAKLKSEIDQLRNIILIYGPLVVAVLAALFVLVWDKLGPKGGH